MAERCKSQKWKERGRKEGRNEGREGGRAYLKDGPREGIGVEEVGEELGHVSELVRLEPVDGRVLLVEGLLEGVLGRGGGREGGRD